MSKTKVRAQGQQTGSSKTEAATEPTEKMAPVAAMRRPDVRREGEDPQESSSSSEDEVEYMVVVSQDVDSDVADEQEPEVHRPVSTLNPLAPVFGCKERELDGDSQLGSAADADRNPAVLVNTEEVEDVTEVVGDVTEPVPEIRDSEEEKEDSVAERRPVVEGRDVGSESPEVIQVLDPELDELETESENLTLRIHDSVWRVKLWLQVKIQLLKAWKMKRILRMMHLRVVNLFQLMVRCCLEKRH